MSRIINCKITNNKTQVIQINYQRATDLMWQYQVEVFPNQIKEIWYIENTLTISPDLNDVSVETCSLFEPTRVVINPTPTATETPTQTATNTPTNTQTPTNTPTNTQTPTNTPTNTSTQTPTNTETSTPTQTPTNTETSTPTNTETSTPTQTPTNTETSTPTNTPTNTETSTPTNTASNTSTPTNTPTNTATPTNTTTPTSTNIPLTVCVVGAGDPNANGTYTFDGIVAGKNSYRKGSYTIVWNSSGSGAWFIQDFPTSKYASTSDVVSPDLAINWASYGAGTAPTVISGPCPSPTPTNTTTPTNTPTQTNTPTNTTTPTITPTESPLPSVCMSGAGDVAANGTYVLTGVVDGLDYYVNGGYQIRYQGTFPSGLWVVKDLSLPSDRYFSTDAVTQPYLITNWFQQNGALPLPTVSQGVCP